MVRLVPQHPWGYKNNPHRDRNTKFQKRKKIKQQENGLQLQ